MRLRETQKIVLPPTADMHVHLRQGEMMKLVTPSIRRGGVDTVFVMPNLQPPIRTVERALEYKSDLQSIEPDVTYLMSLYFHAELTPNVVAEAAKAGLAGIKVYPQGVTTNSDAGVASLDGFDDIFEAMQQHDLVLNLHGEVVGTPAQGLTHEEAFLPTLKSIHAKFPKLRIVLEHCSTAAAIEAVRGCGPSVGATITAHHLYLTGDMSNVDPHAFCKPIPKTPEDRDALLKAATSGDSKFFFGTDSAPHPLASKSAQGMAPPAGVFTQPYATQLVLRAFEEATERGIVAESDVTREKLEGFFNKFGRAFYKLDDNSVNGPKIVLERKGEKIPTSIQGEEGLEVGISRSGDEVFSLRWEK
ncbi:dihydroorotase-like protein [Emericellopsis cladophorae]|uniref:dihydroorotase n=1 Tax=Emericellopsis cladophorae TaxID=2686198 RepID=A0A9Q0BDJ6_9HYPO|nr:dihydroorotase-like protein [Emericellopsis cladophorae]KAI6780244.1 dihydroorotase-like protein [Emericellopsis cladophorae]